MTDVIDRFHEENFFLSNFYEYDVEIDGVVYPSVEHYYQAEKAAIAKDRDYVLQAKTPGQSKRRGRKVALRPNWEEVKDEVMIKALRAKFSSVYLRQLLINTGDALLIEGNNWHDDYWGSCDCYECGGGDNVLGRMLKQVREEIK